MDSLEELSTATVSGLKYDATTNEYIYNWKTASPSPDLPRVRPEAQRGTTHPAYFEFTK